MTIKKLTQGLAVITFAVGCQKSTSLVSTSDSQSPSEAMGSIACQSGSSGLSVSDVKILGVDNIVSDKKTILSLDSNVNCDQAEKAQWSVGNSPLGQGGQVQAVIKGSGVYYIKVKSAETSNGSHSGIANKTTDISVSQNAVRVAVTDSDVMLVGSQVGMEFNSYTFSLVVPKRTTLKTADWNFGGGSPLAHSLVSESHSFPIGKHTFSVVVTDTNDKVTTLNHTITILPMNSGLDCSAEDLAGIEITGPTQVPMSEPFNYALNQPACVQDAISRISWNFGDNSTKANTSQVEHTYTTEGTFQIAVDIWLGSAANPSFTILREVNVVDMMEEIPGPETPVDPNACVNAGSTRTIDGATSTQEVTCGLNGKRTNTMKEQIVQICQANGNVLTWLEQSRSQVVVSEGACQGQSCELNGQQIAHGQTVLLYTTQTPVNTCASVQENRTCENGTLLGSTAAVHSTCQNGCGTFGVDGTVKTGVIVGTVTSAVTCTYGETGIIDTHHQVADQKCQNGTVATTNTRQGDIKTKGTCPTYGWVPTDSYTTCSADCGGTQTRISDCKNDAGVSSDPIRCGNETVISVDERLCDGNPDAVRKNIITTENQEAPSSTTCPKNQIGVIVTDRTVTTTVQMACINHSVQEEKRTQVASAWVQTSYCRDLVPSRCSHDSLSNSEAQGRYDWMVKCQNQVPVIKEFLGKFGEVSYNGISLDDSTRHLYPTFLDSATKKAWIAPKKASASCTIPATAYVASVCVSSCATPEQEILAEVEKGRALRKVTFLDSLTQNLPKVGTLQPDSTLQSTKLEKTDVDSWVTELLDTTQPVLTFKLKSGGHIRITPNHPMLNKDGAMQMASEFKVNDSLVQLGGRSDRIVSIERADYYGKVYNLFVKSNDLKKNVVVINGYLSGTAFYQNEGAQYMNRELLRSTLTRGVFGK